jgi:CMP-N,N'-diacetyllegionaminic acid synthase
MINNLKIISIIPARGGSKGIPKKNIYPIKGKPLIAYSIEASLRSKYIDKTILSSDDDNILNIAKLYGAGIIKRPDTLSTDVAPMEPVIKHAVEQFPGYDLLILLQPTSPLRNVRHIDASIDLFIEKQATSLISVFEPTHSPFKSFRENEKGFLEGLVDNKTPFMRRQDLPKAYTPNGAIYIAYVNDFLRSGTLYSEKTVPFVMEETLSIDIDINTDIEKIDKLLI